MLVSDSIFFAVSSPSESSYALPESVRFAQSLLVSVPPTPGPALVSLGKVEMCSAGSADYLFLLVREHVAEMKIMGSGFFA